MTFILIAGSHFEPEKGYFSSNQFQKGILILPWPHHRERTEAIVQKTSHQRKENPLTTVTTNQIKPFLRYTICVKCFPNALVGVKLFLKKERQL